MLSRVPKLPEPLFIIPKMPPMALAKRFIETKVPTHIVKQILLSGVIQNGAVLISCGQYIQAFKSTTRWAKVKEIMEVAS